MRFFGGLTAVESAQVLDLPVEKVRNELRIAQAWLQREIDGTGPSKKIVSKNRWPFRLTH